VRQVVVLRVRGQRGLTAAAGRDEPDAGEVAVHRDGREECSDVRAAFEARCLDADGLDFGLAHAASIAATARRM
jgi:hypothetical protein